MFTVVVMLKPPTMGPVPTSYQLYVDDIVGPSVSTSGLITLSLDEGIHSIWAKSLHAPTDDESLPSNTLSIILARVQPPALELAEIHFVK